MGRRSMTPGEICLAEFPMGGKGGSKMRPVLFLTGPIGSVPEYVTAYISSVIPPTLLPSDIILDPAQAEYASTRLQTISIVRLHKLATIHRRNIKRQVGVVSPTVLNDVQSRLRILLNT